MKISNYALGLRQLAKFSVDQLQVAFQIAKTYHVTTSRQDRVYRPVHHITLIVLLTDKIVFHFTIPAVSILLKVLDKVNSIIAHY